MGPMMYGSSGPMRIPGPTTMPGMVSSAPKTAPWQQPQTNPLRSQIAMQMGSQPQMGNFPRGTLR